MVSRETVTEAQHLKSWPLVIADTGSGAKRSVVATSLNKVVLLLENKLSVKPAGVPKLVSGVNLNCWPVFVVGFIYTAVRWQAIALDTFLIAFANALCLDVL